MIGGSEEYTGAPYFAGMASLRTGADICHIVCDAAASQAIKSYSPDLIVHPFLRNQSTWSDLGFTDQEKALAHIQSQILQLLSRIHVVVIGPGLGRDPFVLKVTEYALRDIVRLDIPFVVDADGLYMLQKNPSCIRGAIKAVITPNRGEFDRLCAALDITQESDQVLNAVLEMSKKLEGVVVLLKGPSDLISDGTISLRYSAPGNPRRCGGQGDLLSGCLATFIGWSRDQLSSPPPPDPSSSSNLPPLVSACVGASAVIRRAGVLAFDNRGRGVVAGDMLDTIDVDDAMKTCSDFLVI